jgi:hypothetical protein
LLNFIEGNNSNLDQSDYDTSYKVWSGFDIVVRLKGIGLGPDSFQEYQVGFLLKVLLGYKKRYELSIL